MSFSAFLYLAPLFLIPFVVFVLIPKMAPLYRKLQRFLHS